MNKEDLVKATRARGLTDTEARKAVQAFLDSSISAVTSGEDVEFPFGTVHPVKNKRPIRAWKLNKIVVTNKKKYRYYFKTKDL